MKDKYKLLFLIVIGTVIGITAMGVVSGMGWACIITYPGILFSMGLLAICFWSAAIMIPDLSNVILYALLIVLTGLLCVDPLIARMSM